MIAASLLVILLIGFWIFGPDDEPVDSTELANTDVTETEDDQEQEGNVEEEDSSLEDESEEDSSLTNDSEESDSSESNEETMNENIETEQTEPIADDENVIDAYTANWQPIGTEQTGPHTTTFDDGSTDRVEMESAIRLAAGLAEGDMITWWLQNGGDQKVIGTVSNRSETQTYRVYLSWMDNQGWQPTLVEVLKENDQKWRFE